MRLLVEQAPDLPRHVERFPCGEVVARVSLFRGTFGVGVARGVSLEERFRFGVAHSPRAQHLCGGRETVFRGVVCGAFIALGIGSFFFGCKTDDLRHGEHRRLRIALAEHERVRLSGVADARPGGAEEKIEYAVDEADDLPVAAEVLAHEMRVGGGVSGAGRAALRVVRQARVVVTQGGENIRLRVSESVDGLFDVADEEAVIGSGDGGENGVLQGADVLVLVHRHHVVAVGDLPCDIGRVARLVDEQSVGRAGQRREVEGTAAAALLEIAAVEIAERAGEPPERLGEVAVQPVPVLLSVGEERRERRGVRFSAEGFLERRAEFFDGGLEPVLFFQIRAPLL